MLNNTNFAYREVVMKILKRKCECGSDLVSLVQIQRNKKTGGLDKKTVINCTNLRCTVVQECVGQFIPQKGTVSLLTIREVDLNTYYK